jgi:sporulation protein YqfC
LNNYIKELIEICKLPYDEITHNYKIIQLGGKCIYVSNFKKIIDYMPSKIVLKIPYNTLEICGTDMMIEQINKNEILIRGCIQSFCQGVNNEKR